MFAHKVKALLADIHEDATGKKQPVWAAIVSELLHLGTFDDRAPYPTGVPEPVQLPENCSVVLLADWGGDNDAAKRIAGVVRRQTPDFIIHLGDIYYGGTKYECELSLDMWPMRVNMADPKSPLQAQGSFALNGNHEMYSGGEYYFNTVLPAFGQKQPFFCLENSSWRIIGLDTAYNDGRLKPQSPTDPMNTQWNWLIDTLRKEKKATIFLTHHQPVSAHQAEFSDSKPLREDINELMQMDGVGDDAIFGWFFGHETNIVLFVFDVLVNRWKDVKHLALSERLPLLQSAVVPSERVQLSEHFGGQVSRFVSAVRQMGGEGVVAKRLTSHYEPGKRSGAWAKKRLNIGQEFVIGGFTPGSHGIDALVVGFYSGNALVYAARVRAGLVPATRRELHARVKPLIVEQCPFANLPELTSGRWGQGLTAAKMRECIWVKPKLVANCEFLQWTDTSHVRHIKFVGLRTDKNPRQVVRE